MKIKLIVIGKTEERYLAEGIEKYCNRIKHYASFEIIVLADVKQGGKLTTDKLKEEEAKIILNKIEQSDYLILLDEKGKEFTSIDFAAFIQKKLNAGSSSIIFVVGGAFGFSTAVYERANEKLSLSAMTFSHQMIRLLFTEQLYRAFTILKGEKYHHQ